MPLSITTYFTFLRVRIAIGSSRVYRVYHSAHRLPQEVALFEGYTFRAVQNALIQRSLNVRRLRHGGPNFRHSPRCWKPLNLFDAVFRDKPREQHPTTLAGFLTP